MLIFKDLENINGCLAHPWKNILSPYLQNKNVCTSSISTWLLYVSMIAEKSLKQQFPV